METMDCGFSRGERWFRYRACAIIKKDDSILMVTNPSVAYLYSVGGGVGHNETAEEAVRREVLEETGTNMEVDRLAVVHENFFHGPFLGEVRLCHEIALYFLMKATKLDALKGSGTSHDGQPERLVWVPMKDFSKANIYPGFLPQVLKGKGICHIVSRE